MLSLMPIICTAGVNGHLNTKRGCPAFWQKAVNKNNDFIRSNRGGNAIRVTAKL